MNLVFSHETAGADIGGIQDRKRVKVKGNVNSRKDFVNPTNNNEMGYSFAGLYAGGNMNVEGAKGFSSNAGLTIGEVSASGAIKITDTNITYLSALESQGSITIESKGNSINTYGQWFHFCTRKCFYFD